MKCNHTNSHAVPCGKPHWNKLICSDCGKWLKWLGKDYRPTTPKQPIKPSRDLSDIGIITRPDALGRQRAVWHYSRKGQD